MSGLIAVDDRPALIPGGGGLEILPPRDEATTLVPSPVAPFRVAPPAAPSPVIVLPAPGPAGHDGVDGATGDVVDPDLLDLTTLFENGLH